MGAFKPVNLEGGQEVVPSINVFRLILHEYTLLQSDFSHSLTAYRSSEHRKVPFPRESVGLLISQDKSILD